MSAHDVESNLFITNSLSGKVKMKVSLKHFYIQWNHLFSYL